MKYPAGKLTAADQVLLAADDLTSQGAVEFSEFELTVATWTRCPETFGLRGYREKYPDHKRVTMEIMGSAKSKRTNPVTRGFMLKVRPNTYRLTPMGIAEAKRLRTGGPKVESPAEPVALAERSHYDHVAGTAFHPAFLLWRIDPDLPRLWVDVADFLGADQQAWSKMKETRVRIHDAMAHCNQAGSDRLRKESGRSKSEEIHYNTLSDLVDFLKVIEFRFQKELRARG